MADKKPERTKKALPTNKVLVLSAGAPQSPLMAGALCAFVEQEKTFDIIYTSGAGALVGLLFVAPKEKSPDKALEGLVELGVSDLIYRFLPVNYKAFFKPGRFTQPIHRFVQHFKLGTFRFAPIPESQSAEGKWINAYAEAVETRLERRIDGFTRLYNDLVDLWAAAITPTTLSYWSKGVCQPLPFLEDSVDFGKLKGFSGDFYVNAFSPDLAREESERQSKAQDGKSGTGSGMTLFHNKGTGREQIGPEQVRAAFAYPFIYPPVKIDGRLYFEGADRDPIGFGNLIKLIDEKEGIDLVKDGGAAETTIVLIDILASLSKYLLREPRNLWDAFGISIMVPVVAHAQNEVARFERLRTRLKKEGKPCPEFLKLPFEIKPEELGPHITDWSYSNMSALFQIGRKAGKDFLNTHAAEI